MIKEIKELLIIPVSQLTGAQVMRLAELGRALEIQNSILKG